MDEIEVILHKEDMHLSIWFNEYYEHCGDQIGPYLRRAYYVKNGSIFERILKSEKLDPINIKRWPKTLTEAQVTLTLLGFDPRKLVDV